jgi:sulfite exporter TauE/SafE
MVGGLVLGISASHAAKLAAAGTAAPSFAHRMRPHIAFNVGRIVGFGVLGALLGLIGSSLSLPTRLMAILVLAVAVVMFLLGVRLTGVSPRMAAWSPKLPAGLSRALGIDTAAEGSYSDVRTGLVGAATFFLPCGFTQAVQIYAISTANPLTAGLVMATFAVGTTPGLLALATVPEVSTGKSRDTVLRVVGVVVLAFALLNVSGAMNLLGVTRASSPSASSTLTTQKASDNVTIAGGVQTVTMTQTPRGYEPADTTLYAGLPTKWVINATSQYDCSAFLRVPDLGQQINLTQGINTVDLSTLQAGVIPFTCVMGMYSGNLIVVDPPKAPATTGTGTKAAAGPTAGPVTS